MKPEETSSINLLPDQFRLRVDSPAASILPALVLAAVIGAITLVLLEISDSPANASEYVPADGSDSRNAPASIPEDALFVPGELLITFVTPDPDAQIPTAMLASEALPEGIAFESRIGRSDTWVAQVIEGSELETAAAIATDSRIKYAEPNYIYHASEIPDDTRFAELWGMHNTGQSGGTVDADIDAPEAWDINTGTSTLVVAVIDTGVNYLHEDLADNMWVNQAEFTGVPGEDDDGNGHIDDIYGIDTVGTGDSDPMDDNDHGSHVAGTVGAVGNNALGVSGVAQNVSIMAVKFLNSSGSGNTGDAIEAFQYVIDMKQSGVNIKITQNSWGGGPFSQGLFDIMNKAGALGILHMAAAGNSGTDNDVTPHYPSSFELPYVVAVAASDHNDARASFSQYGSLSVDIAAPGTNILSTELGDTYGTKNGTSMATPMVSGIAALIASAHPTSTAAQIRRLLLNSIDALPAWEGLVSTGGRANAYNALVNDGSTSTLLVLSPDAGTVLYTGTSTTLEVDVLAGPDVVSGASVMASFSSGDTPVALLDDGVGVDATSRDSIYSVVWTPSIAGNVVVSVAAGKPGVSTSTRTLSLEVRHSDPPRNIVAIAGNAQSTVSWDPPMNPGISPTLSYQVISVPAGGSTTTSASVTTTVVTGLTNGTPYAFVVKAINAQGTSASSTASITVTPKLPGDIRVTSTPISLIASPETIFTQAVTVFNDGPGILTLDASISDAAVGGDVTGGPDAFGYTYQDSDEPGGPAFSWIDIIDSGTPIISGNDARVAIPIGFDFEFYGIEYDTLWVATNGIAGFTSLNIAEYITHSLPKVTTPNNLIAAFWDDLFVTSSDHLVYELRGDAPGRELVVTWDQVESNFNSSDSYTFQMILSETSHFIKFQYDSIVGVNSRATLGIENDSGKVGLEVSRLTDYVKDDLAVLISPPALTVAPVSAVIPAGSSTDLTIRLNAFVHPTGTSSPVLSISSDDPDETLIEIPLEVEVSAGAPGRPTDVIAVEGVGSATVNWVPPSDDGGAPVVSYTVTASPGSTSTTVGGTTTMATLSGLPSGGRHTLTVVAFNGAATSTASEQSNPVVPYTGALIVNSTGNAPDFDPVDGVCNVTDGSPVCTLRAAMEESNASAGYQAILFDIAISDPGYIASTTSFRISPTGTLPFIEDAVLIDGYSQSEATGNTAPFGSALNTVIKIELDGGLIADGSPDGLDLIAGDSTIRGIAIGGFSGSGIIVSSGGNHVEGNFLGVDVMGTTGNGNAVDGVAFGSGSTSTVNVVGGIHPRQANLISGNAAGVSITGISIPGVNIEGNLIGTDINGSAAIPNTRSGVLISSGAPKVVVGVRSGGAGNVISGNGMHGIEIVGSDSGSGAVTIAGNRIGTSASGVAALANGRYGIFIDDSSLITIGGNTSAERNVISGNGRHGVAISGTSSNSNSIWSNTIGASPDGETAVPNGDAGVIIKNGASDTRIGGTEAIGNLIAYNGGDGIRILSSSAASSTENVISYNSIHSNGGLGIDLAIVGYDLGTCIDCPGDGVTTNALSVEGLDGDGIQLDDDVHVLRDGTMSRQSQLQSLDLGSDFSVLGNNSQPFPEITSVLRDTSITTISGTFTGSATSTYILEYFSSSACDPSGYGEGETFLLQEPITTDGSGNAAFSGEVPSVLASDLHVTMTATDVSENTSEFSACAGGPVLNITVEDAVGDPVAGAAVFIYDADSTSEFPLIEGRFLSTDSNGQLLVDSLSISATGTVLISVVSNTPNLALRATSSLPAVITIDPSSTTNVVFTAIDVDGNPMLGDAVRVSARDAWTVPAAATLGGGLASVLMTPGEYQIQFWSSTDRYVFVFPDVTIHPTTTSFSLDARVIGTGDLGVDFTGDFDDLYMFPVHERSLTFPFMNPANGQIVKVSPGSWDAFIDLQKTSGSLIWRYSVNIWDDLAVTDGSIATTTTGGTFQAVLSPVSNSFALGESPLLNLSVQDGVGHAMRGVFTTDLSFNNVTNRDARLTVTYPNGATFVDITGNAAWGSTYTVTLPDGAVPGPYTATLTFISHQGTTIATTTFQVGGWDFGDAPDQRYRSSTASDGARHQLIDHIRLGATNTGEPDAIAQNGDSDDGLVSSDSHLIVSVVNDSWFSTSTGATTNGSGVPLVYLNVLVDWDEDGDWEGSQDWALQNLPIALAAGGSIELNTGIPLPLLKWIRITVSDAVLENYIGTGLINAGETEDYFFYQTPSSHDPYFSTGHDASSSWVHASGLSRYHEPLVSIGGLHDVRQSLAHDPFYSVEHDVSTSWIHDATYTNYHDPIVSGTGIDPVEYLAHDPFFSAGHDPATSWVHDVGPSTWHSASTSASTGLFQHNAASSLGHDPYLSQQHDSGTSWIHDGAISAFHEPAISGIGTTTVTLAIEGFATTEYLGHDAFFSEGHDSVTSWIHDSSLSAYHDPAISSVDVDFKFHEVSLSLGHDSFLSKHHDALTSWTHDGVYSNYHDPVPSVWGGHDPVASVAHDVLLSTIHDPLESGGGNQHTVESLRHEAFFSGNHDAIASWIHDGAFSNSHVPMDSALGYRDAEESLVHDPYLSAQHHPDTSWIHDGAYSTWHEPLLSTATGTQLHLATESLGHNAFFSVNHDPNTSWKHNGSDSFWHVPTISAATSSATTSRLTLLESAVAHEAFFSNGHDPETTWFHDSFVSGWQHPQAARDGHDAVVSLGHEPALSRGHDVLTSYSHEGSISNWIAPPAP